LPPLAPILIPLQMWDLTNGTVDRLHRLLDRRAGVTDRDRAVDRSLLFGGDKLADIALPLLHDVLGGLESGRPHPRAEGGERLSPVRRGGRLRQLWGTVRGRPP